MRFRPDLPIALPMRFRRMPKGIDEADWIDIVNSEPIDDRLAVVFDPACKHYGSQCEDLKDYIDRRGFDA